MSDPLRERIDLITGDEFVHTRVHAVVRPACAPDECRVDLVQDIGTGRATVRYAFSDGTRAFGKLYTDDRAQHANDVLSALRDAGFGGDTEFRTPEPLAFDAGLGFLLCSAVPGPSMIEWCGRDGPEPVAYARRAARFLARLHQAPVRVGKPQSLWDTLEVFTLVTRLAKAVEAAPKRRARLVLYFNALGRGAKVGPRAVAPVQTHGRPEYGHVHIDGDTTGMIDFDESAPADPGLDLAIFVYLTRIRTFMITRSTRLAAEPVAAFLGEYAAHLPGNLVNLDIHLGALLLKRIFRLERRRAKGRRSPVVRDRNIVNFDSDTETYEPDLEFLETEFFRVFPDVQDRTRELGRQS